MRRINFIATSREIERLRKRLLRQVRAAFPVGERVEFTHGKHLLAGTVIAHGDSWWVAPVIFVETARGSKMRIAASRTKTWMSAENGRNG